MIFSFLVSLVTGVLFGLAPALQSTRFALVPALKGTTAQAGNVRSWLRSALVVAQLALSLMLLVGAGLVLHALQQLRTMNPGFNPNNALTLSMDVALQGYDKAKGEQFYRQLITRVESVPGVRSAALTSFIPLSLNYSSSTVYVEGQPSGRGANAPTAMAASVGPRYFETMGTPLLYGREFSPQDTADSEATAIVNETFVRRMFSSLNSSSEAIGKRISFNSPTGPFYKIVGLVRDGKYFNIAEEPRMFAWTPLAQSYSPNISLMVRTSGDPEVAIPAVRNEVLALDPNLPVFEVKSLNQHMKLSLFPARVAATVLGGFGLVALTLAVIGIYGVTSYSVSQRTREIGIRVALGAQRGDVLKMILSHGAKLAAVGVALGLLGSVALTRVITSLLFGITPTYVVTFAIVALGLALVTLFACYIPARRATKVDPLEALRYE
jgi:predicted permease